MLGVLDDEFYVASLDHGALVEDDDVLPYLVGRREVMSYVDDRDSKLRVEGEQVLEDGGAQRCDDPPPPTTPPPTTPTPTTTPNLPDPPTSLVVTRDANSVLTVSVGYTQSSGSVHNYQIELHSAATENGTYALQATSNDSTASPAVFQYQLTDSWFKARGRNCSAAERTDCGTWSDWSAAIAPPTYLFLTNIRSSIEATESVSVSGWAFNLDPLSRYSIRVTTSGGDIGFNSDCTDNQEDITVPAGSSHYNFNVVPSLYACDAPAGMITATLLSGGATVYTYEELIIGPVSVQVDNAFPKSSEVAERL